MKIIAKDFIGFNFNAIILYNIRVCVLSVVIIHHHNHHRTTYYTFESFE